MTHQIDDWTNCYDLGWKGLITDESFSHPAKFSHGLIKHIFQHALQDGLIQPGGVVLDPFGGVGLGALYALQYGLHWVGVELEEKFVSLGQANIALWNERFGPHFPNWGSAALLQGDSRQLAEIIAGAGLVVGSPPFSPIGNNPAGRHQSVRSDYGQYAESPEATGFDSIGQLGTMPEGNIQAVIASPSFAGNTGGRGEASRNGIDAALFDRHSGGMKGGTGDDPANLDHLPMTPGNTRRGMGTLVVGSPPYADGCAHQGGDDPNPEYIEGGKRGAYGVAIVGSPPYAESIIDDKRSGGGIDLSKVKNKRSAQGKHFQGNTPMTYGSTPGQLGAMKAGELAVVGSPPFADNLATDTRKILNDTWQGLDVNGNKRGGAILNLDYGSTPNQLGNATGETFWSAARTIIEQCALLLPPGAVAIWVVKRYVKNGKIVDFPGQWRQLCEACGFETIHEHRAWLVKDNGTQADMFGGSQPNLTERKSFFRRLGEARQKAAAHWETLARNDQAGLLWSSHGRVWENYYTRLALFNLSDEEKQKAGVSKITKPPYPNRNRILLEARATGWKRDGKPHYEIMTAIDFETVLCMVRR